MLPIADTTMRTVEYALGALATRADVAANNVANINTPGFQARRVEFESSLQQALRAGDPAGAAAPAVLPGDGLPDAQGNTVDLETELVGMIKDQVLRDAMVAAYNFKVGVTRTAITGS